MGTIYLLGVQTRKKIVKTRSKRSDFDKMHEVLPFPCSCKKFCNRFSEGNDIPVYTKKILRQAFFFSEMQHSGLNRAKLAYYRVVAEVCVQAKRYRRSLYKAKRVLRVTKTVQNDTKTGASVPEIQIRGTDASIT